MGGVGGLTLAAFLAAVPLHRTSASRPPLSSRSTRPRLPSSSSLMRAKVGVEVIFWWFKVLGNLQGTHCEYQKALDGHNNDSYAHQAVDRPRRFMAGTARTVLK